MNRTIYIGNPAYIKCQNDQMKIVDPVTKDEKGSIPIEDVAYLVLDHTQITLSHYLLVRLVECRAAIVTCDAQHLPLSIQLPLAGHSEHTERILQQMQISEPLKKNLWKQTIQAKVHNQARVLQSFGTQAEKLLDMIPEVRSGDTTNCEGVAAKKYWADLFSDFQRDREGAAPNPLLNFGYGILLSIVARALCSAGMHLAIGIHHKNKYNPYCLASDIMEPYRPYVDRMILELGEIELTHSTKTELLTMMQLDVKIDGKLRPLQVAASITAASLYRCLRAEERILKYPYM